MGHFCFRRGLHGGSTGGGHTHVQSCSTIDPPNVSFTKSPVLKPAAGRNSVLLATPTSLFDSPNSLQKRKSMGDYFLIAYFLVSSSHETFVKEIAGFGRRLS